MTMNNVSPTASPIGGTSLRCADKKYRLQLSLRGSSRSSEIAWRGLSIRSAIGNLPESGQPLHCDVPLVSLAPLDALLRGRALKNAIPQSRTPEPIRFLGQPFTGGYGLARNSAISFRLQPDYKTFVALVGCSFSNPPAPSAYRIDDRVAWEQPVISSLSPAEQLHLPIPPGSKTLTLENGDGPHYGFAAFASAGFLTK